MPKFIRLPLDDEYAGAELATFGIQRKARCTTGQQLLFSTGVALLAFAGLFSMYVSGSDAEKGLSLGAGLQPLVPQGHRGCGSVILLSPGRSATNSLSNTVVASSTLKFCHPGFVPTNLNWYQGIKE
jgi:hypothetical protein